MQPAKHADTFATAFQRSRGAAWRALDDAYAGHAPQAANLRLNNLLFNLVYANLVLRREKLPSRTQSVAKELSRFLERLRARARVSEGATINGYMKLSSEAQDILGSMMSLETRELVDNFAQIDFSLAHHHEALLAATERARTWIAEPQGRPSRAHLNAFFDGVTELFSGIPNVDLNVSNHRNGQPHTPLENVLYAGHQMIDVCVTYHGTVKAYHRR
jgi:hypothetical protein